jgi:putative sterol carrier protein
MAMVDLIELSEGTDAEIAERIHAAGTGEVLDAVFVGMPGNFQADKASGVDAKIQWVITDGGDEHAYVISVADGACTTEPGRTDSPRVTLSTDLASFLKLIAGKAAGPQLYMTGKLKLQGDMMLAQRMGTFFAPPA